MTEWEAALRKHLQLKVSSICSKNLRFWYNNRIQNLVKTYRESRMEPSEVRSVWETWLWALFLGGRFLLPFPQSEHVASVNCPATRLVAWNLKSGCCSGFRTPACMLHAFLFRAEKYFMLCTWGDFSTTNAQAHPRSIQSVSLGVGPKCQCV